MKLKTDIFRPSVLVGLCGGMGLGQPIYQMKDNFSSVTKYKPRYNKTYRSGPSKHRNSIKHLFQLRTQGMVSYTISVLCHVRFHIPHNVSIPDLRLDYGGLGPYCSIHASMYFFSRLLIFQ